MVFSVTETLIIITLVTLFLWLNFHRKYSITNKKIMQIQDSLDKMYKFFGELDILEEKQEMLNETVQNYLGEITESYRSLLEHLEDNDIVTIKENKSNNRIN